MALITFNLGDPNGLLNDDSTIVVQKCLTAITQALQITEATKNSWSVCKVGISSVKDPETRKYVDQTTYELYCFVEDIRVYLIIEQKQDDDRIYVSVYVGPYINLKDYLVSNSKSIYFTLQLSNGYQIITDKPLMYKRAIKIINN